jgi:hypothetical protein
LARHLGQFGEIRITRLEPETAVAWEGALASGTVRLEPSGWGTRVILTARRISDPEPAAEPDVVAEAAPEVPPDPEPVRRGGGLLSRIIGFFRPPPGPEFEFDAPRKPPAPPEPAGPEAVADTPEQDADGVDPAGVLASALDSLGQAHHRPFSRG